MSKYSGRDDIESGAVIEIKAGGRFTPAGTYTVMSWPPSDSGHFSGFGGTAGRRSMHTLHEDQIVSVHRQSMRTLSEEPEAAPVDEPTEDEPVKPDPEPAEVKPDSVTAAVKATTKPAAKKTTTRKKASTDGKTDRKS